MFLETLTNTDYTLNGAISNKSSLSKCVDLFSQGVSSPDKQRLISEAMQEDLITAIKVVLYLRDVRSGQGNKDIARAFHKLVDDKLVNYPEFHTRYCNLLGYLVEIGSWKDVYDLYSITSSDRLQTQILEYVFFSLKHEDSLCAKWFPRQSQFHHDYSKFTGQSLGDVRRQVASLSSTVEQQMCTNQWKSIIYDHVPTRANLKYSKAFLKHDEKRRQTYLSSPFNNIKSSVAYPHEIVHKCHSDADTANAMWKALPDYMEKAETFNILPIIDTSGSMTSNAYSSYTCMDIAIGLGLYFSEHNKGSYKDVWCNFSNEPTFMSLTGSTLDSRISNLDYRNWGQSTNLQAVFDRILDIHTKTNKPDELPKAVIIVSDMEFNYSGANRTNFEAIKDKYARHLLTPPVIIFWRVDVKSDQQPVTIHDSGSILINGYSPSIMKLILSMNLKDLQDITPLSMMTKTIQDKYQFVEDIFKD